MEKNGEEDSLSSRYCYQYDSVVPFLYATEYLHTPWQKFLYNPKRREGLELQDLVDKLYGPGNSIQKSFPNLLEEYENGIEAIIAAQGQPVG